MLIAHYISDQNDDWFNIDLTIDSKKMKGQNLVVHATTDEWYSVQVSSGWPLPGKQIIMRFDKYDKRDLLHFRFFFRKEKTDFRCCYAIKDETKWDNNSGWNYCLNFDLTNDEIQCSICYDEKTFIVVPRCFHRHYFCTKCLTKLKNVCAFCQKKVLSQ
jgi:hypothetical protein